MSVEHVQTRTRIGDSEISYLRRPFTIARSSMITDSCCFRRNYSPTSTPLDSTGVITSSGNSSAACNRIWS